MSQKAPCPKSFQGMIQGMKMCVLQMVAPLRGAWRLEVTLLRVLPKQEVCRVERGEVILSTHLTNQLGALYTSTTKSFLFHRPTVHCRHYIRERFAEA